MSDFGYEPIYDAGEVALVDALRREFGEAAFAATLRKYRDARPFCGEDGIWRLRLGAVELWLDELGRIAYGVQEGPNLFTGYLGDDGWEHDPITRLYDPEDN
jgi:hypothetical protein